MPNAGNSGTGSGSSSSGASAGRGDGNNSGGGGGGGGRDSDWRRAQNAARAQRVREAKIKEYTTGATGQRVKGYWETIQQWRIDEGKSYARTRGNAIARMAASGMKEGTDQWKANLATIDVAHDKTMAGYADSATQGILDNWAEVIQPTPSGRTPLLQSYNPDYEAPARKTTDELLTEAFGITEDYDTLTDASGEQATADAAEDMRKRAQRGRVQEASPWWA